MTGLVLIPRKTALSKDEIRKMLDLEDFSTYRQKKVLENVSKSQKSPGTLSTALSLLRDTGKTMEIVCEACALLSEGKGVIIITHHEANIRYINTQIQYVCASLRIPIATLDAKPRYQIIDRCPQPQDLLLLKDEKEVVHLVDPI